MKFPEIGRECYLPNLGVTGILQNWEKLLFIKFAINWNSQKLGETAICQICKKLEFSKIGRMKIPEIERKCYLPNLGETGILQN